MERRQHIKIEMATFLIYNILTYMLNLIYNISTLTLNDDSYGTYENSDQRIVPPPSPELWIHISIRPGKNAGEYQIHSRRPSFPFMCLLAKAHITIAFNQTLVTWRFKHKSR